MSDSQQPQTPLARLEQLERQIASKVDEVVQGLRHEIGQGVRDAGEEIQRLLEAVREKAAERPEPEPQPEPEPVAAAPAGPDVADLVDTVARIDGQSGQADVIKTLLTETAPYSSRAVFFLIRQHQIRAWSSRGFGSASGRVEGVHATSDQAPWSGVGSDATVALDADQVDAFAQALGSSAGAQAAWIPFFLRGQLAGALYVDRLDGDGSLDVSPLQLLTHCAALSLETAASSPGASATLTFRGKLPEVIAEEHTIAVDDEEEAAAEEVEEIEEEAAAEEVEEIEEEAAAEEVEEEAPVEEAEAEFEAEAEVEEFEAEAEEATEPTEETTGETTGVEDAEESTEITDEELTAEGEIEEDQEIDTAAGIAMPAMELPKMKLSVPGVSVPEEPAAELAPEELAEPPEFEMVEDEAPEYELDSASARELPEEAFAAPPEVPEIELGEPEPAPEFEVAEAPEVPDIELGEPEPAAAEERMAPPEVPEIELGSADEVSTGDIAFEAEDETPLDEEDEDEDEDTNIWEVEEDEPTAVGEDEEPAAPQPADFAQGTGNETVRIDTTHLRQAPAVEAPALETPTLETQAVETPPPTPAADSSSSVQYPSSFAEPPPPVQPPPPSFAEPETPEESYEPSASQVVPPPDLAPPQPSSQVVPPADATPTSEVAPPEPSGGSTEVKPPTDLEGPGLAFAAPTAAQTERELDDAEEALHEEARRLARLLVSEIKLYNEEIIEEGRRTGNIYDRLKDDINRSRQMYEERIDPRLADQEDYFQQELVQRLAGGDESLLGM